MNEKILELIKTYPTGGGYTWGKGPDAAKKTGVTKQLDYQGQMLLAADVDSYCSGICFEIWFELVGQHLNIAFDEMRTVQRLFYNAANNRRGAYDALIKIGKGQAQTLQTAKAGDMLQLWRRPVPPNTIGSGHQTIYLSHDRDYLTYYSAQKPVTNGRGVRREMLANMVELHIVRPLAA